MINVAVDKFSINRFWEKTPTALKYILVLVIFITVSYFLMSKNIEKASIKELDQMQVGIKATYELIDNFERFKTDQMAYNEQVLNYIHDLHVLVQELNENTNRKLDMIIASGAKSESQQILLEKIMLLNESFDKLSKVYQSNMKEDLPESDRLKTQIIVRKADPTRKLDTIK
jgi:uncharacterized protein YaaW (UPF0174 family)